jgi:hypothetical protein
MEGVGHLEPLGLDNNLRMTGRKEQCLGPPVVLPNKQKQVMLCTWGQS